jgi:hypothetical protein
MSQHTHRMIIMAQCAGKHNLHSYIAKAAQRLRTRKRTDTSYSRNPRIL